MKLSTRGIYTLNFFTIVSDIPEYFSAARTQSVNSLPQIISLNAIINPNNRFNSTIFSPSISSYYWFHMSTGLQECCMSKISLVIGNSSAASLTSYSSLPDIEMSVDRIKWIEATDKVYLFSETPLLSDNSGKITFIGFRADNIVLSSVTLQLLLLYELRSGSIYINIDDVTYGSAIASNWTITLLSGVMNLKAPKTGVYILVVNIQIYEAGSFEMSDRLDKIKDRYIKWTLTAAKSQTVNVQYRQTVTSLREHPALSLIYLVSLNSNDNTMFQFENFTYDDFSIKVAIQLMLYKPKPSSGMKIVWAIKQLGKSEYFVQLNDGRTWNESINTVKISVAGVYYISLSAIIEINVAHKIRILLNNSQPIITLSIKLTEIGTDFEGLFTLQQSALLHLMNNDILQVNNFEGSQTELYFVGIFISPK